MATAAQSLRDKAAEVRKGELTRDSGNGLSASSSKVQADIDVMTRDLKRREVSYEV